MPHRNPWLTGVAVVTAGITGIASWLLGSSSSPRSSHSDRYFASRYRSSSNPGSTRRFAIAFGQASQAADSTRDLDGNGAVSECAICLDELRSGSPNGICTPCCAQIFHQRCLWGWLEGSSNELGYAYTWHTRDPTCPNCRAQLDVINRDELRSAPETRSHSTSSERSWGTAAGYTAGQAVPPPPPLVPVAVGALFTMTVDSSRPSRYSALSDRITPTSTCPSTPAQPTTPAHSHSQIPAIGNRTAGTRHPIYLEQQPTTLRRIHESHSDNDSFPQPIPTATMNRQSRPTQQYQGVQRQRRQQQRGARPAPAPTVASTDAATINGDSRPPPPSCRYIPSHFNETQRRDWVQRLCFQCHEPGHIAVNCPRRRQRRQAGDPAMGTSQARGQGLISAQGTPFARQRVTSIGQRRRDLGRQLSRA